MGETREHPVSGKSYGCFQAIGRMLATAEMRAQSCRLLKSLLLRPKSRACSPKPREGGARPRTIAAPRFRSLRMPRPSDLIAAKPPVGPDHVKFCRHLHEESFDRRV